MLLNLKKRFENFIRNDKDYPLLTGLVAGLYPFLFYYSNNYESVNSLQHLLFFSGLFLVLPTVSGFVFYRIFKKIPALAKYKKQFLFVFLIMVTASLLSQVYFLTLKKKLLLGLLVAAVLLAVKFGREYKRLLAIAMILTGIALLNLIRIAYNSEWGYDENWMVQKDHIESVKFVKKPNVYLIEPDGYAGENAMNGPVYNYKDTIYDWLRAQSFTVYNGTNSNYPASLASNASMFGMKHHYFGKNITSAIEIPKARHVIVGNNPVVKTFRNNGYKSFFIVEDEYFQKNFTPGLYDFYNIRNEEIPFFSKDDIVKKDVYADLERSILLHKNDPQPRFFFVEKLLPHHIHFDGTGKANERKVYLEKIEQTNTWLKKAIALIARNDPNGIVIIASDHGGWVGLENWNEFYGATDPKLIESIYGNLIAIKWNQGQNTNPVALKSTVNIFRVLFSELAQDPKLLENLQDDSAYNYKEGFFSGKAVKVIDNK